MGSVSNTKLRIACGSGGCTDRRPAFLNLARNEGVQFIVGDWLSEYNMITRGASKIDSQGSSEEFEPTFLEAIEPALPYLQQNKVKVAVNAGASDPRKLHDVLIKMIQSQGLDLKVAWIEGDEVIEALKQARKNGNDFVSLTSGRKLEDWGHEPIYAQCYLGSWGIVEAFKHGADIVICGRVADACPTIASAAYHYGWSRTDYDQLARAFVAGHMIECSTYVSGGDFTGFKSLPGDSLDLGFPIIEMDPDGEFVVTKEKNRDGIVSVETAKSQLVYEIQGPYYYNSDVVAVLDGIKVEEVSKDRVRITGVGSRKPPPTTKVGITAIGGYQAEAHYFLCGLDIAEKAEMFERQARHAMDESRFQTLSFRAYGSCAINPSNQDAATVDLRIFAQSRDKTSVSYPNFFRPLTDIILQSYPGATFAVDARQAEPKLFYEYWVTVLPQSEIKHVAHLPFKDLDIPISAPSDTLDFLYQQPSYETDSPVDLSTLGPTITAPIGYIVHARSGDKGSDCNVGFFVRHEDEWDWLRSLLTIDKIKHLLGDDYSGNRIDRSELPNLWAVHFLLKDHLDRGVASSSSYDFLGKNVAEYLRSKHVDVPKKFLDRGKI